MAGVDALSRVRAALEARNFAVEIREFPESTRTAEEAAAAVGVDVGQIGKSLVFLAVDYEGRQAPFLAIVSGRNRADMAKLSRHLRADVRRAPADLVREATGFAIGGVPPVGHASQLAVVIDQDLEQYPLLFLAAGTPHAVFPCSYADLVRLTGGEPVDLREDPAVTA
ncbi:MAG: YbaK/EbsC family protein [Symbiobacteriia bacterium]